MLKLNSLVNRIELKWPPRFVHIIFSLLLLGPSLALAEMQMQTITMKSNAAKQDIEFDVYLPADYTSRVDSRYPVFLTTAGSSRMAMLTTQIDWLSHVDFGPIPKVIVVTLPDIDLGAVADKYTGASGALDDLTAKVLEQDLLPYVDKHFRTQPYRLIEGFSSWGNFPLFVFRHYPHLFNAYLVLSPALELDESGLVDSFQSIAANSRFNNKFLYLSFATFNGVDEHFLKIVEALKPLDGKDQTSIITKDIRHENYIASPVIGLNNGVSKLFSDLIPTPSRFTHSGYAGVQSYFKQLEAKYGFEIDSQTAILDLSFYYVETGEAQKALETMGHIVDLSSDNSLLLVRLAAIESQVGRHDKARATLNRALVLARNNGNEERTSYIQRQLDSLERE